MSMCGILRGCGCVDAAAADEGRQAGKQQAAPKDRTGRGKEWQVRGATGWGSTCTN